MFEDAACAREVLDLHVKCPTDGCGWTGELRNVEVGPGGEIIEENKCLLILTTVLKSIPLHVSVLFWPLDRLLGPSTVSEP